MSVDGPTVGPVKRLSGQVSADELSAALAEDKIEWAEAGIEAIHAEYGEQGVRRSCAACRIIAKSECAAQ